MYSTPGRGFSTLFGIYEVPRTDQGHRRPPELIWTSGIYHGTTLVTSVPPIGLCDQLRGHPTPTGLDERPRGHFIPTRAPTIVKGVNNEPYIRPGGYPSLPDIQKCIRWSSRKILKLKTTPRDLGYRPEYLGGPICFSISSYNDHLIPLRPN